MGRAQLVKTGQIVAYRLTADDLRRVEAQRDSTAGLVGDAHVPGELVPMVVVRVAGDGLEVDGQAFLLGNDSLYVAGAVEGPDDGQWEVL